MSLGEVEHAIRKLSQEGDHVQTPGWCRFAAEKMLETATKADKTAPLAIKEILVYFPSDQSPEGETVHYALSAKSPKGKTIVFNPNPAAMFPQYIGPLDLAPGLIKQMTAIEKVS